MDGRSLSRRYTFIRKCFTPYLFPGIVLRPIKGNPLTIETGLAYLTGLQMTPGFSQAWKSHTRFPHPQPSDDYGTMISCQVCWQIEAMA
jgi:hypothetical protein